MYDALSQDEARHSDGQDIYLTVVVRRCSVLTFLVLAVVACVHLPVVDVVVVVVLVAARVIGA